LLLDSSAGLLLDSSAGQLPPPPPPNHARTPLHNAAFSGDVAQLRAALADAAGAAGAAGGSDGASAGGGGNEGVLSALRARTDGARSAGRMPLHIAALKARAGAVEELLRATRDAGGDDAAVIEALSTADNDGKTPLMHAAAAARGDAACKALLHAAREASGDAGVKAVLLAADKNKLTALMCAATKQSPSAARVCEALLSAAREAGALREVLDATAVHDRTACAPHRCDSLLLYHDGMLLRCALRTLPSRSCACLRLRRQPRLAARRHHAGCTWLRLMAPRT
jgi:hypothetical protein